MRKILFVVVSCLLLAALPMAYCQEGGQETIIPQSFWGMTVHTYCDVTSDPTYCQNQGNFGFPAMPFNWARTVGTGMTWNQMELCDPAGNWCPIAGSGCAASYTTSTTHNDPAGGAGTQNNFTNANGASVSCLRPGIDGTMTVHVCQSAIWCSGGGNGTPCIPNLKTATDPTNCAYGWNNSATDQFDQFIPRYNNGQFGLVPVMLNISGSPDFASVAGSRCTAAGMSFNGTDGTCASASYNTSNTATFCSGDPLERDSAFESTYYQPSGACVQPHDADNTIGVDDGDGDDGGDGKGPDTILKNFMIAMFAHMHNYYGTNSSETIQYIEIGNEPNDCVSWFHADGISGSGSGAGPCPAIKSGTINPPASANDLVRMAADIRAIATNTTTYNLTGTVPQIVSAPTVGAGSFKGYLSTILNDENTLAISGGVGGTTQQFDLIGFHGYYTPAVATSSNYGFCTDEPESTGTVLPNCPVPETFAGPGGLWEELFFTLTNNGTCGSYTKCNPYYVTGSGVYIPTIDTEFSWGENTNVVSGDQRAALASRSYILQAQFYPELSQVNWYGEDFLPVAFCYNNDPSGCGTGPGGGTGQFWSPTSISNSPDTDQCTTAATTQGGFICQAGIAMEMVNAWLGSSPSVKRGFVQPSSGQACTCTGPNCSHAPPTGVWSCPLALSGVPSYVAEIVWDNTQTKFPCSTNSFSRACGSTVYTLPSTYTGSHAANSQWQTLDGTLQQITSTQTTVGIGAKPILIENQKIATRFTPVD